MRYLAPLVVVVTVLAAVTGFAQTASPQGVPNSPADLIQTADPITYPIAKPGVVLSFPRDHGAHPEFRTEWWYVTGWLTIADGPKSGDKLGFQVTFFRTRPGIDEANPSRFTADQVLFAHAALSDPAIGHLMHGERSARAGFGIAEAATNDADITLRDWHFRRRPDGNFFADITTPDFAFSLAFDPTQAVLPQGEGGYSRKGPAVKDASVYYSMPHLAVSGTLTRDGTPTKVTGEAWLDREWASSYLARNAVGWDWTGLNFEDGSALMAFRIRGAADAASKETRDRARTNRSNVEEAVPRKDGPSSSDMTIGPQRVNSSDTVWAGGSFRRPDGSIVRLQPGDVHFETTTTWRSPRTGAVYPVEQMLTIRLPEGKRRFPLKPMFADQELDGRTGGLPVYWEGAVTTTGGRGYLELTGYASRLRM